jgi:hypothetical protein
VLLLAACQPNPATVVMSDLTPTAKASSEIDATTPTETTSEPMPLATPLSDSPAAGICDFYPGELVTFEIYPDIPSPRCARATPEQRLKIVNRTEQELTMWIGSYEFALLPDQEKVIDAELRSFLAPGVHQISITAYSGGGGPELWLTTDP